MKIYFIYYFDFELQGHLGCIKVHPPNNNIINNNWDRYSMDIYATDSFLVTLNLSIQEKDKGFQGGWLGGGWFWFHRWKKIILSFGCFGLLGDFVCWVFLSLGDFQVDILYFCLEVGDFVFWVILSLGYFATLPLEIHLYRGFCIAYCWTWDMSL